MQRSKRLPPAHPVDRHLFSHAPPAFPPPQLPNTLHSVLNLQSVLRRDLHLVFPPTSPTSPTSPSSTAHPPSTNPITALHLTLAAAHIPYDGETPSADFIEAVLQTGLVDDLFHVLRLATRPPPCKRPIRFNLPRLLTLLHSYVLASDLLAARMADNHVSVPLLLTPMYTPQAIDITIPLVEEVMHAAPRYTHFQLAPLPRFPALIDALSPFQLGAMCRVLALFIDDRDNAYLCSNDAPGAPATPPPVPPNTDWRRIEKPEELLKTRRSYLDTRGKLARERNHAALLSIPDLLDKLVKIVAIPPPVHEDIVIIDEALRSGIHAAGRAVTTTTATTNNQNNNNHHAHNDADNTANNHANHSQNNSNSDSGPVDDERAALAEVRRRVLVMVYRRLIGSQTIEAPLVQADTWEMLDTCINEAEYLWADTGFIGHAVGPLMDNEPLSQTPTQQQQHQQQAGIRTDDAAAWEAAMAVPAYAMGGAEGQNAVLIMEEADAALEEWEDAMQAAAQAAQAATEAMDVADAAEAAVMDAGHALAVNGVDVQDLDTVQGDAAVASVDRSSIDDGRDVGGDADNGVDVGENGDGVGNDGGDGDGSGGHVQAIMEVEVVGDVVGDVPGHGGDGLEMGVQAGENDDVEVIEVDVDGGGGANNNQNNSDSGNDGDRMDHMLEEHTLWIMSTVMLTHQVEALFVLYTLMNGKRRAEVRQRLMDVGIFSVVNRMFDALDWSDARNETRTEDMLKVHLLRMVHYLCDGIDDNTLGDDGEGRKQLFTEGELEVIEAIEKGTWSEKYVVQPVGSGVEKAALRLVAERNDNWNETVRVGTKGVKPALHFCVIHGECNICAGALAEAKSEGAGEESTRWEGASNVNRERGVMMKIVEILMGTLAGDEVNIGRRYLLSGCVETFQRSATMAEKTFVGRQGLVEHLVEQVCASEQLTSHKNQFRQTSFDLLGHLVKWNRELFGVMNELLTGNHKVLTRLLETVSERLIDSNVFVRSIALSLERFRAEDEMGLSAEAYPFERCVLWAFVEKWKVAIVYDLMRSVHVEDVNYENISSVNTALIMFVIYGGETEAEMDVLLRRVVDHLLACVQADASDDLWKEVGANWQGEGKCDVVAALGVLDNFAKVVSFWMGYYMHQASDVTPLEVSTDIGFERFVHSARLLLKRLPLMDAAVRQSVCGGYNLDMTSVAGGRVVGSRGDVAGAGGGGGVMGVGYAEGTGQCDDASGNRDGNQEVKGSGGGGSSGGSGHGEISDDGCVGDGSAFEDGAAAILARGGVGQNVGAYRGSMGHGWVMNSL